MVLNNQIEIWGTWCFCQTLAEEQRVAPEAAERQLKAAAVAAHGATNSRA